MNIACPAIDPEAGGAQSLVSAVDCFVKSSVQDGYATLLGQGSVFSQALTIGLTLYVAITGYRLIFGRSSLSMGEFVPKALLIGAVLALSSNWAAYQVLVFDLLTDGPQEVASMIGSQGGTAQSITARVDAVSDRLADIATEWSAASAPQIPTPASPSLLPKPIIGDSSGPNILLLSALLLVLTSAGVLAVSKVLLGLLLALGPIFVALGLFGLTRGLAFGWLRVCVLLALVPLLSLMTSAGALAMIEPMVIDMAMGAAAGEFSLSAALSLFVAILVMAAVSFQLFRISTAITANWTASLSNTVRSTQSAQTDVVSPPVLISESSPVNPRVDILINSLERANMAALPAPTMRRDIAPITPLLIESGGLIGNDAKGSRQNFNTARASQVRATLRPVRSAA